LLRTRGHLLIGRAANQRRDDEQSIIDSAVGNELLELLDLDLAAKIVLV
jgi:hypothetical protein